jgi:hypothetical protein
MPGSHNDTIPHIDLLFRIAVGDPLACSLTANDHDYDGYYLVDRIYYALPKFMKKIPTPRNEGS